MSSGAPPTMVAPPGAAWGAAEAVRASRPRLRRPFELAGRWADRLSDERTAFDVVGSMTLAILLLMIDDIWYLRAPVGVLGLIGLIHRPLLRTASFWFAMTLVLAAGHAFLWFYIDNHKYLLTYWCLGLGLSRLAADPRVALATNARYLIGLCFFFATLWKLLTPDFADGTFFHFTLLTDSRFGGVASLAGGAPDGMAAVHVGLLETLRAHDSSLASVLLQDTPRIPQIAAFLAIWTILVEGAIALAFLWPRDRFISRGRDYLLAIFLITCYPIATVVGFAWLLTAMGLAQCRATPAARLLYVAAFLLMPLYQYLPFRSLLGALLS